MDGWLMMSVLRKSAVPFPPDRSPDPFIARTLHTRREHPRTRPTQPTTHIPLLHTLWGPGPALQLSSQRLVFLLQLLP